MVRLPPINEPQNDPNRHLRLEGFPIAFTAWRNRNTDPWAEPPDPRPQRLPTDRTIWNPHPQYILNWDQPVALEQQPIDIPPIYRCCPVPREGTVDRARPHIRGMDRVPFPTTRRAIGLPSTSNDEPDHLPDADIPKEIRILPDVPHNIDPEEDQRTS